MKTWQQCKNADHLVIWNDWPKSTEGFDFVSFQLQRTKKWRCFGNLLASTLHEFTKRFTLMLLYVSCVCIYNSFYESIGPCPRLFDSLQGNYCWTANYERDYGYLVDQFDCWMQNYFFSNFACAYKSDWSIEVYHTFRQFFFSRLISDI